MQVLVERLQPTRNGRLQIVPNINRSNVRLPESVERPRLPVRLDRERPVRRLDDRELVAIVVEYSADELKAHPGLALDIVFDEALFAVLDQSGRPIAPAEKGRVRLDLAKERASSTKGRGRDQGVLVHLEARTFVGSPRLEAEAARHVVCRFVDGAGALLVEQSRFTGAELRSADFVFVGDDAAPERLFIADVGENGPSLAEVRAAAAVLGVPVSDVPLAVNLGDSWLQDQFQIAHTATREQTQQVIVHLPRVAHDAAIVPGAPNLRSFVDTHFASQSIGLFNDCWDKKIEATDQATRLVLSVGESFVVHKAIARIFKLLGRLRRRVQSRVPRVEFRKIAPNDLYRVRLEIDEALARLAAARDAKRDDAEDLPRLAREVEVVCGGLRRRGAEVTLVVTTHKQGEQRLVFDERNAQALADFVAELRAVHSSHNYGGNIEVSPPMGPAPHGRILAGTLPDGDVRALLRSRASLQPLSIAATSWLEVGHIDEIAAFCPSATGGFAVLRAAPLVAEALLSRAAAAARAGRPVTRLFRGKKWLHEGDGVNEPRLPPRAYLRLARPGVRYALEPLGSTRIDRASSDRYGDSAFHDDRQFLLLSQRAKAHARYAAFTTCADLLEACGIANRAIDALFLGADDYRIADDLSLRDFYLYAGEESYRKEVQPYKLDKTLAADFGGVPVVPVPVLFDRIDDVWIEGAKAIVPAAVNFQTLGNALLVPRPNGPRMHVADAIDFFLTWKDSGLATRPDASFIRTRGLDRTGHWTRAGETVARAALGRWPTPFDPDYDEMEKSTASAAAVDTITSPHPSTYAIQHADDPFANHPVAEPEDLRRIAHYFRDGFPEFVNPPVDYCRGDTKDAHPRQDRYEADIAKVEERIRRANPNAFDPAGKLMSSQWTRIEIPEETVDLFELHVELALAPLGVRVHWVDAWYYHVHSGGIHCGTNVLRRR